MTVTQNHDQLPFKIYIKANIWTNLSATRKAGAMETIVREYVFYARAFFKIQKLVFYVFEMTSKTQKTLSSLSNR